jgi:hypothetical protein
MNTEIEPIREYTTDRSKILDSNYFIVVLGLHERERHTHKEKGESKTVRFNVRSRKRESPVQQEIWREILTVNY